MDYRFYTADVFSDRPFAGNPLAVFPQAEGLTPQQMQKVAAEFNLSETVFVVPPETPEGTRRLYIFTPKTELPFAGHPTLGTAYVLAAIGEIELLTEDEVNIIFEEGVGNVPVKIRFRQGKPIYTELTSAKLPEYRSDVPSIAELATILGLNPEDFLTGEYTLQAVSCGVPFLFVPLRDRQALAHIHFNRERWQQILTNAWASQIYVFCFDPELEGSDVRSRMFAPGMGILEDPATGAAATALAGYLAIRDSLGTGTLHWRVEQGFEMGRPSFLEVEADKENGEITAIRVGGSSVFISEGTMQIPFLTD